MALSLVVLTENLLAGITNPQLQAFADSIPAEDRPFWKERLPGLPILEDYVKGVQTDRNARDENGELILPHPKVAQPIHAGLIRDDATPYAMPLDRWYPDGSAKVHWVGRVNGQTLAALALVRDALIAAGRTSMFMWVPNANLRDRVAQLPGVQIDGTKATLVFA